jgi:Flp pilus assembly protein TadD
MAAVRIRTILAVGGLLAAVTLTYSNHFENGFHFDDSHTVVDNPWIRTLHNAPKFFTDARTFSVLPANRSYRPLVSLALAIDYRLGHGLNPAWFQASTFFWYLLQLVMMYCLFRRICDLTLPGPRNQWIALFAAALYGLHPAMAETVNYVIQRGDLYSTAGVIAALLIYASFPRARRFGLYLGPLGAALLSKPPALVFPAILFAYIWLFEETRCFEALKRSFPALLFTCAFGSLIQAMTPKSWTAGAASAFAYRLTQPLVALRYFRTFFFPNHLSADTDHQAVTSLLQDNAWLGFVFVIVVVLLAIRCSKSRTWRPAAFGLWWFLLALIPASIFPLAEVENDHRMFFPFVGLALAVSWTIARAATYRAATVRERFLRAAAASLCLIVLAACALGTRHRNEVWRTDESLWHDVTVKSPHNGRGLMNYGLTQMTKGDARRALDYFERALAYNPAYSTLEINLGIANGLLNRDATAERHFLRALQLAPGDPISHYFYARWLNQKGRSPEAAIHAQQASAGNPDYLAARALITEIRARMGAPAPTPVTPEAYLNVSLAHHQAGRFPESIDAARKALELKPDYPEAWNNIAAAYEAMRMWDPAIAAAREALKLRPEFQLARNNLLWSEQQKLKTEERPLTLASH